jgi:hypothetical protein
LTLLEYIGAQEEDITLSKEERDTLAINIILVSQLVSIENNQTENFGLIVESLLSFENWVKLIQTKAVKGSY